ncbi:DUF971 domain-containing protein [Luteolibacter sp. LG18]|uniref:DUF971 domain-containing protein n=1 Tax=Luteolibacter sp. LG18 TaxID=2819286 RepID=UPI0030C745E9
MAATFAQATVIGTELAISFSDGEELYLALPMLRRACPCANCQGEPDALGRVVKPVVEHGPRAFELVKIDTVGGYALQLGWADGHATGLYSFEYLRRLALLGE